MAVERSRAAAARAQELGATFGRISDSFERIGLVALNAGLEGARLGENAGRALLLVSDEVRMQSSRGGEAARDLSSALGEVAAELGQLGAQVTQARDSGGDVAQDAARVGTACGEAASAIADVGERLRRATGSDPEVVRAIAEAGENARALVASLTALSGKVPRNLLLAALRPVLEPLARLLSDEGEDEGSE
jgi:methyl-accepting chemotaxis protein